MRAEPLSPGNRVKALFKKIKHATSMGKGMTIDSLCAKLVADSVAAFFIV